MPKRFNRLIEPFSGMAAITIAAACARKANEYYINDINLPIVNLLQAAIETPGALIAAYTEIWQGQFAFAKGHIEHFYYIRDTFNEGSQDAAFMLYLIARCVKGAVRYGSNGNFNQSPDKRRHGTTPQNISENVRAISSLLKGKAVFSALDYREVLEMARPGDLVYMDPPYQGVTNSRDKRYFSGVDFNEFAEALMRLKDRGIDFLVSYDGECGGKAYGEELPGTLNCNKVLLNAGISTQATLLGKRQTTLEALYISERLCGNAPMHPIQLSLIEVAI